MDLEILLSVVDLEILLSVVDLEILLSVVALDILLSVVALDILLSCAVDLDILLSVAIILETLLSGTTPCPPSPQSISVAYRPGVSGLQRPSLQLMAHNWKYIKHSRKH